MSEKAAMEMCNSQIYGNLDSIEEIQMRGASNPLEIFSDTNSMSDYAEIDMSATCAESRKKDVDSISTVGDTAGKAKVGVESHRRKLPLLPTVSCFTLVLAIVSNVLLVILVVFAALVYIKVAKFQNDAPVIDNFALEIEEVLSGSINEVLSNISEELREQTKLTDYLCECSMPSPSSCSDVLGINESSASGHYQVKTTPGQQASVYCDMNRSCGGLAGGWMRVADLNPEDCPDGLKPEANRSQVRGCVAKTDEPGCAFVFYQTHNVLYSKVCVKVRGYGLGTFDGLYHQGNLRSSNIMSNYLDGVSITANAYHIWSFIAGNCMITNKPAFINYDWSCDGTHCNAGRFCSNLWNSVLSGEDTPFLKLLPAPISSDIIVRVCRDEPRSNEDIAITELELYVQ